MVTRQDRHRPTDLSLAGARQLAQARANREGARISDDVVERPWGWAFHRVGGPPLPPGPSSLIIVTRDGKVEVPSSVFGIEDYDRRFGLLPPLPSPPLPLSSRWYVRLLLHASWMALVFAFIFIAGWWLKLGTQR